MAHCGKVWTNSSERGLEASRSCQHIPHHGQLRLLTLTTEEIIGKKHFTFFSSKFKH